MERSIPPYISSEFNVSFYFLFLFNLLLQESITNTTFLFTFIGFNVETVKRKNLSFSVWDVGGQDQVCHKKKKRCFVTNTIL